MKDLLSQVGACFHAFTGAHFALLTPLWAELDSELAPPSAPGKIVCSQITSAGGFEGGRLDSVHVHLKNVWAIHLTGYFDGNQVKSLPNVQLCLLGLMLQNAPVKGASCNYKMPLSLSLSLSSIYIYIYIHHL